MTTPPSSDPSSPEARLGRPVEPSRKPLPLLLATVRLLSVGFVMVPISILYWVLCVPLLPFRERRIELGNLYGKIIGRTVQRLTGIIPEIHHRERMEEYRPAIYVMNHTATIDMWIGMWLCPYRGCGMAKKEIVRVPIFGQAYWLSGHLLLDRGNREKAIASMDAARQVVQKHQLSMWIWPEGTRSRSGRLKRFKKGFVHMAIATGLPIVPCVAHNAHLYWPGGGIKARPGRLQMEILPAISTDGWSSETVEQHVDEVMDAFRAVLGENQQEQLEPPAPAEAPPQG
ncbi:MAG: 1-acyl-sn-glycerol-3-phosphate acyltransferase [Deltaproteobacteria bacterium]|nr:1-acyl-sn-glycerol-3-phosphate acyltransferase [Deltaproteobacteria bacterium]